MAFVNHSTECIGSNGEPDFTSQPFNIPQYQSNVEVGSYVKYTSCNRVCYGRVISSVALSTVKINQFMLLEELNHMDIGFKENPIQNRYILVKELVQTDHTHMVSASEIDGIIFLFRHDDIINGTYPCEGIENAFVVRYQFVSGNTNIICSNMCLPFPCSYLTSPVAMSFARRVFDGLYTVRKSTTHLMCRNSQNNGRGFIQGNQSFFISTELWLYISAFCAKNRIVIHGPFSSRTSHLQARAHVDINCVKVNGELYIIRWETTSDFSSFDRLFGTYSRYGTSMKRPKGGESLPMSLHHHIYNMGGGISMRPENLRRRDPTNLGIDLRYNMWSSMLSISLRYHLQKASNCIIMKDIIRQRELFQGQSPKFKKYSSESTGENVEPDFSKTVKAGNYFNLNSCTYKVMEDFCADRTLSMCAVTSSVNNNISVGSRHPFAYSVIHREVVNLLNSLMPS